MENTNKLVEHIDKTIANIFPNSYRSVKVEKLLGGPTIIVSFSLTKREDWPNRYFENDDVATRFIVHIEDDTHFEANLLTGSISVKPEPGSYLAINRVKTQWRKTHGDWEKVAKAFDRYFARLYNQLKENRENLYHDVSREYV